MEISAISSRIQDLQAQLAGIAFYLVCQRVTDPVDHNHYQLCVLRNNLFGIAGLAPAPVRNPLDSMGIEFLFDIPYVVTTHN